MLFHSKQAAPPAADGEVHVKRRRDHMAGLWAAELLGLLGHAAKDYAHDLAHAHDGDHDGDEKLVQRLVKDLKGKAAVSEIREKLAQLVHEARRQLHGGGSSKS